jgi:hypothetical protein
LLVRQIAISREEHVEVADGQGEQFTIPLASPAHFPALFSRAAAGGISAE